MEVWQQRFAQKTGQMKPGEKWTLTEVYNLQVDNLEPGWKQFVQHHAFARFHCSQCWHTWHSAQVHILFHMHLDRKQRRGRVKVRLFRQECRVCLVPQLEPPEFSQEDVERVLDNLMLKIRGKCYREPIDPNDLTKIVVEDQTTGPHESARCEACRLGICYVKDEAQEPANTFFIPASLFPPVIPAHQEGSEAETGSRGICHVKDEAQEPANTFFRPASLFPPVIPAHQEGSEAETGSSCDWRLCCCLTCCLVILLAAIIFVLVYFLTGKWKFGGRTP